MDKHSYTIAEVAKMLKVSPSTVSRAINNAPGVSDSIREKILNFVDEIGYRPNTIAQSLSRGKSNMVALILGDIRNPFYADLAFGIQKNLDTHGYIVTTFNSEYDFRKEIEFIQFAKQYHYCGIILVTVNSKEADKYINKLELPILLVNRITEHYSGSFVVTDNFQAGYIAARHLINLGHKKISFMSGHHKSSTASYQRFLGYRQALKNYCLTYNEQYCLFDLNWKMETGYEAAKKIFSLSSSPDFPSAFLLSNDLLALGFMDYCEEHGIRIPDDISLVSFDNIVYSGLHRIQLTTVSQHVEKISSEASKVMIDLLEEPSKEPRKIIIEPTLIERNTTRAYKNAES
ncbi:MAG: LacI family DNA-binding transcriptional regulator [Clostridiales bacterium]|nr:LacI family DNA-binding transcriptional regulator [Clostridiales bacterium]